MTHGEVRTTSATGGQKGVKPERFDLIPVAELEEVARLYGWGAGKYEAYNWARGYEWSKSYQAMQRHANAFWRGEETDVESGLSHLAHMIFHGLTLMYFAKHHRGYDDRHIPVPEGYAEAKQAYRPEQIGSAEAEQAGHEVTYRVEDLSKAIAKGKAAIRTQSDRPYPQL